MRISCVRSLKKYGRFWTENWVVWRSVPGQNLWVDISFPMEGCAKAIVAKAKEAGLVLTGAGATYPYGKDPKDSNIRIAPSFPTVEELAVAVEIFVLSVKLVSIDKLLEA